MLSDELTWVGSLQYSESSPGISVTIQMALRPLVTQANLWSRLSPAAEVWRTVSLRDTCSHAWLSLRAGVCSILSRTWLVVLNFHRGFAKERLNIRPSFHPLSFPPTQPAGWWKRASWPRIPSVQTGRSSSSWGPTAVCATTRFVLERLVTLLCARFDVRHNVVGRV